MSNGHARANCVVVMGSKGILFPLTKPLHYINPFLFKNGTVAPKKRYHFLPERLPFLAEITGVY